MEVVQGESLYPLFSSLVQCINYIELFVLAKGSSSDTLMSLAFLSSTHILFSSLYLHQKTPSYDLHSSTNTLALFHMKTITQAFCSNICRSLESKCTVYLVSLVQFLYCGNIHYLCSINENLKYINHIQYSQSDMLIFQTGYQDM